MVLWIIESVTLFAVLLYGALGEMVTEKSGHLNLGTPGIMCFGGVGGCLGAYWAIKMVGNSSVFAAILIIVFSLLFTIIFGGLIGLLYSFLTVTLRANQNITGLAITTFGGAGANFLGRRISNAQLLMNTANKYYGAMFGITDQSPSGVRLFFGYGFLVYLALIIAILAYFFFKKTKTGLRLRAVGESPSTADAAGVNVAKYRYLATIVGSAIAGLGGLTYVMVHMHGAFEQAVSIESLGWLAVALVIFSIWRPNICIFGSFIFALLFQLPSSGIFSVGFVGAEILNTVPYVVTIIILIITSIFGGKNVQPPQALGTNYFREDR